MFLRRFSPKVFHLTSRNEMRLASPPHVTRHHPTTQPPTRRAYPHFHIITAVSRSTSRRPSSRARRLNCLSGPNPWNIYTPPLPDFLSFLSSPNFWHEVKLSVLSQATLHCRMIGSVSVAQVRRITHFLPTLSPLLGQEGHCGRFITWCKGT